MTSPVRTGLGLWKTRTGCGFADLWPSDVTPVALVAVRGDDCVKLARTADFDQAVALHACDVCE